LIGPHHVDVGMMQTYAKVPQFLVTYNESVMHDKDVIKDSNPKWFLLFFLR